MAEDTRLGTRVLDRFGTTVADMVSEKPQTAANLLLRAFELKQFQTRHLPERGLLPSGRAGARIALESVTGALEHPREAVLTSIFLPTEIFQAMGLRPLVAEALSDFITGAHAEEGFVRAAEQRGIPETYCSYHKVLLGAATAKVLAPPRLIANCSVACDANNTTFRWLAEGLGAPQVYVDVPYAYDAESCAYVADQLRELAHVAEDVYGRALDVAELSRAVGRSQQTLAALVRGLPLRRGRYLANDMGLEMQQALALHPSLGQRDTLAMAERMLVDFPRAEAYRGLSLAWMHTAPYFSYSLQQMLSQNQGAQSIVSDMCYDQVSFDGWEHGAGEPYEAMAERLIKNAFNGPASRRVGRLRRLAEETGADGVVCFCHWGCKETMGASQLAKRELEAAGIPVLVLDGDGCHRANNAEGQASTRLGAFLEMLRARKADGGGRVAVSAGDGAPAPAGSTGNVGAGAVDDGDAEEVA